LAIGPDNQTVGVIEGDEPLLHGRSRRPKLRRILPQLLVVTFKPLKRRIDQLTHVRARHPRRRHDAIVRRGRRIALAQPDQQGGEKRHEHRYENQQRDRRANAAGT
jgi:hypothetical protein